MGGSHEHDAHVHSEVEDLENLGFGKHEDDDTAELGERYAGKYLERAKETSQI